MPSATVTILNRLGLHARPAAKFVQTAARFESQISVARNDKNVNGKSIMGMMMLAAAQGVEIEITTEGSDAEEALSVLTALVANRFGEESM